MMNMKNEQKEWVELKEGWERKKSVERKRKWREEVVDVNRN